MNLPMGKSYSILIFPRGETKVRRLHLSQMSLRYLAFAGILALALCGWFFGDYLWMKMQGSRVRQLKKEARVQREQLTVLEQQTKNLQGLLATWKGLQQRIQASLPSRNGAPVGSHLPITELEKSLASLRQELQHLIDSVPASLPTTGRVTSGVGTRASPWTGKPEFHAGLDIPQPIGTPVYAPADGMVEMTGVINGNGQTVILDHGQGITTEYLHLSKIDVKKGERVRKGQEIAKSGNTGRTTSPHLHYEVRINGVPIDPRPTLIRQSSPPS